MATTDGAHAAGVPVGLWEETSIAGEQTGQRSGDGHRKATTVIHYGKRGRAGLVTRYMYNKFLQKAARAKEERHRKDDAKQNLRKL